MKTSLKETVEWYGFFFQTMKVIFLGTNGWYDTVTGDTVCILIKTDTQYIILDAGNAFYKISEHITDDKPIYLFLSHFHLDHIVGLHILNKFNFTQGIQIYGPTGTRGILNTLVNKPYTAPFNELQLNVEICELPEEKEGLPFYVESKPLLHSSLTLGFRFEVENKTITYCPDTGYCENAVKLARNADLLIAECAYKSGQQNDKWPHLNPETAARLAVNAKAKKMALVHFDASIYLSLDERKNAEKHAKDIFNNTVATRDNMQLEV